jgi:hypothetical protein
VGPSQVTPQENRDQLNEQGVGASVEHDHANFAAEKSSFVVSIFSVTSTDGRSVDELKFFLRLSRKNGLSVLNSTV